MSAVRTFGNFARRSNARPEKTEARPMGFLVGWRAFRIYSGLSKLSDAELARRGLNRIDLPRVAAIRAGLIKG